MSAPSTSTLGDASSSSTTSTTTIGSSTIATTIPAHSSGWTANHLYLKLGHLIPDGAVDGISQIATRIECAVRCSLVTCQVFTVEPIAPTGFLCTTFTGVHSLGWSSGTASLAYFDESQAFALHGNETCLHEAVTMAGVLRVSPTHDEDCEWEMAVSEGGKVVLVWVDFDTEKGWDFVSISDPCVTPLSWIHYTGTVLPPPFTSSCDRIRLRLRTDRSGASKGFVAALSESRFNAK
ncbi:uncharacterized protein LOC125036454 [Penaeus chinensis]|uniref:uncharacterized protein LOC125036454 n=1 Tax=Penaeus chinensis TaxID=139456 RepID=UPI001FB6784C|nr:uncharacterized protein LOC125036454 [Penaeus chinensis]